ncbi:MAG: DUF5309 family protein [Steroidobacteraceae bacterium]|nr:DUF5309 family protein [Steroidobacteraceae bacterium]
MTVISGQRLTTNILADQLATDISSQISLLEPSAQPLAVFTRAAGKERTIASKFHWTLDESKARYAAIDNAAGYNGSATTLKVTDASAFAKFDTVLVTRTGEYMQVMDTNVQNSTVDVVRGVGNNGTGTSINDEDELLIVASAQPEGDRAKAPRSQNPVKITNYTQIFREPFAESGTLRASGFQVHPADWPHQTRKAGIEHTKDIEYAFVFGRKDARTVNGAELRTTGGIIHQIATNQVDAGGTLTEEEFNAGMAQIMRYGSRKKLAIASATGAMALNKFPASKQITRNDETTYGMDVTLFQSPFGSLNLVYHPLLEGEKYGGVIIVVDLDDVAYRYLGNDQETRDTKILHNRQEPDRDGRMSEYLTECGVEWGNEIKHGLFTGITS